MTRIDLLLSVTGSITTPFYQEFPPADDLRAFIACTWVRLVRQSGGKAPDAILPDGCAGGGCGHFPGGAGTTDYP
jgi:hypothetical protein